MMNRINQNNQLFSKSFFDDRQINYFLRNRYEKKAFFRSSSSNRNNRLRYETKVDHEMKKIDLKIVFDRARRIRKESHLSNAASQRNHLSCLVCHLNQEKTWRIFFFISETSTKRSIIDSVIFSTKRQVLKSNSIIILMSSFNQSVVVVSFFSVLFTAKVNTSSIESISSTSIFSVLKRHFELRYRLDFFDSLDFLIMKCMKNVTNSQQILKSRSYKKIMNDLSRNEWLKIMKNENKSLLINETWNLINFFKNRRVFRDKWVYKIKREKHDEILRYKARWVIRDFE